LEGQKVWGEETAKRPKDTKGGLKGRERKELGGARLEKEGRREKGKIEGIEKMKECGKWARERGKT